jgi:Na+/melibiose symporter-like transporter
MLRVVGLVTRTPLLLLAFFPESSMEVSSGHIYHYIFLGIFLVYYFGNIIIFPAINVLLKTNYRHKNFGKLYSYTTSVNKIVTMVTVFVYGLLLDADNFAFTYVIPLAGLMGISSLFALSRIDYSKVIQTPRAASLKESIKHSVNRMINILKTNKPYLHFEIGFMFYGFSFMITVVIINIFFEDGLGLNYTSVAFYKNAYNILAIVLLPFAGRLLGNIDPRKFASITFGSLFLYTLFLLLTDIFPVHFEGWNITFYPVLLVAFVFYGIFAATMVLLWNIGSAYFCQPEEADDYQSVHLSLTGLRAIIAPIFGVFFYELMGFRGTFILAMISLAISVGLMRWSYERDKIKKDKSQ